MGSDELVARLRAQRPNGEPISVARLMDEAADRIEALTAQLAEARESERAAVVAWLRDRKEVSAYYIDYVETAQAADAIEAGEHLT